MARLLLPPGAAVLSYTAEAVPQPPKDTGTVLGVIERDPVNYYRRGGHGDLLPGLASVLFAVCNCAGTVVWAPLPRAGQATPLPPACCGLCWDEVHDGRESAQALPFQLASPRPAAPASTLAVRSYEVVLLDGTHLQMTAAALLGRIYVLGASAPEARWQECGPALQEVARSFRLRYRV